MKLRPAAAAELADSLELDIDLDRFRRPLEHMARAILRGSSTGAIIRERDRVGPQLWGDGLRGATEVALERRRAALSRELELLDAVAGDLAPFERPFPRAVLDRIMAELLDAGDRNIAALEELERELGCAAPEERPLLATRALRGAAFQAGIPENELRAAVVRVARGASRRGLGAPDTAETAARHLARLLATDERRRLAREWTVAMATGSERPAPLLARELHTHADRPPLADPADDVLWLNACIGLAIMSGLDMS